MKQRFFIAGTDTDVGKTRVSESLLIGARLQGLSTVGLKPLAAGAVDIDGEQRNPDAVCLMRASSVAMPYDTVNPVLLHEPMAPHIAADREGKRLSLQALAGYCRGALMSARADFTLIEGAGGWYVPLNQRETLAGFPQALNLEVVLVVGMKLGCLNHALLTAEAIQRDGLTLRGWIANCLEPDMNGLEENIQTLQQRIRAPLVGVHPYVKEGEQPNANWVNPALFTSPGNRQSSAQPNE
ncbi:dethiobiotin synthase [Reinekea blandensis]|uniref:ATP-dependent dethiobiotin synthetase BioD n=1 Tax=Reinekea blandensis MED297 TaxID=314283 RepID=A4BGD8_9GAMM|nr:dethiobiotin synthase [Reinekea blandensis]EAR08744.1 dithiobiotin synthetase [Reinekea sp. MED297] [Reinekea blandensis MED297]